MIEIEKIDREIRMKKIFGMLIVAMLIISSFIGTIGVLGAEQEPNEPNANYYVSNIWELQNATSDGDDWGQYILTNDIDASITQTWNGGLGFEPISPFYGWIGSESFGSDKIYTISNLYINRPTETPVGLIGLSTGVLERIKLDNVTIIGNQYVGALVGQQQCDVWECSATNVNVTGNSFVGGLIGRSAIFSLNRDSEISNCSVEGKVYGSTFVGGFAGHTSAYDKIPHVTKIKDCYANVNVTSTHPSGFIDTNYGTNISNCYSSGELNDLDTVDKYGFVRSSSNSGEYNGYITIPTISNCHYDTDTSGATDTTYANSNTTIEMMQQSTFVNWDFINSWDIVETYTYPYLNYQMPLIYHNPIRINSDSEFIAPNGVTSGTGTSVDPYIIENWDIDATGYGCGIYVGNTTKYFEINNCTIYNASGFLVEYYHNSGIYLYNLENGTIFNNSILRNRYGIYLDMSNYNNIIGNIISNGVSFGIISYDSDYNNIIGNDILNNPNGLYLYTPSIYNNVYHNNFIGNTFNGYYILINYWNSTYQFGGNYYDDYSGVDLYHGINQDILGSDGIGDLSFSLSSGQDYYPLMYPFETNNTPLADSGEDNIISFGTIYQFDGSESSDAGGTSLNWTWTFSYNSTSQEIWGEYPSFEFWTLGVYDITLTAMDDCYNTDIDTVQITVLMMHLPIRINSDIDFTFANGVSSGTGTIGDPYIIENWDIDATGYGCGIYVGNTTKYFEINNCTIYNASGQTFTMFYNDVGIYLYNLENAILYNNTITGNYYGICLMSSSSNNITGNNISENNYGIYLLSSSSNNIIGNNVLGNVFNGIRLRISSNNNITGNNISGSNYGILLGTSSSNYIYHNNFVGNSIQVEDDSTNYWNNTYQFGGNYYDNYIGTDLYHGENQDISGSDGIGDTPFIFTTGQDYYPLVYPFETNNTPIADAGIDQYYTGIHHINGMNSSDAGGTSLNYTWIFIYNSITYTYWDESFDFDFIIEGTYFINLTVEDDVYSTVVDMMVIYAFPLTADAGSDDTAYRQVQHQLDGTGSYGYNINYTWTFTDVTLQTLYGSQPYYTFTSYGVYNITLTITDYYSDIVIDWVEITVVNSLPFADAGINQTYNKGMYSLNGLLSTDVDGSIVDYLWTFDDGGLQTLNGGTPTYVFQNFGIYVIMLRVTDNDGAYGYDNTTISILNTLPIADAGTNQTGIRGTYNMVGTGSYDPDGTIIWYNWTFTHNGIQYWYNNTNSFSFYFSEIGNYEITLNVTDNDGGSNEDTVWINIITSNPVADAGVDQSGQKNTYYMSGNNSYDLDNGIVWYNWTFNYNSTQYWFNDTSWFNFYFYQQGNYEITLKVTDIDSLYDEDTMWVNITWLNPIADAGVDQTGKRLLSLDGSGSYDPDGIITDYLWTFNDGSPQALTGVNPSFDFNNSGTFVVMLRVTDNDGLYGYSNVTMEIVIIPPVAVANREPRSSTNKGIFMLDGLSSYDPDGTIMDWIWEISYNGGTSVYKNGKISSYSCLLEGTYDITLTVRDDDWRYDSDTMIIEIIFKYPQSMPVVYLNDTNKGIKILDGRSSTDEDGFISLYYWQVGRNGIPLFTDTGVMVNRSFTLEGIYYVNLTVTDDDGLSDWKNITFQIIWKPPVADAGIDRIYTLTQGDTMRNITLNASASYDIDGYIDNYTWSYVYNNVTYYLYGEIVTFQTPNNKSYVYNITLNITDDDGLTAEDTVIIEVITPIDLSMLWIWMIIILTVIGFVVMIILRKLKDVQGGMNFDGKQPDKKFVSKGKQI